MRIICLIPWKGNRHLLPYGC